MTRPSDKEILAMIKKQREKEHEIVHAIVMKYKGITAMNKRK